MGLSRDWDHVNQHLSQIQFRSEGVIPYISAVTWHHMQIRASITCGLEERAQGAFAMIREIKANP